MKRISTILLIMMLLLPLPLIDGTDSGSDQLDLGDIIPLSTQVPIDFSGWERDGNSDGIDDMLLTPGILDREDGFFGINVHVNGPVDREHVKSIIEKAGSLGMDPVFLHVGKYSTAIYLLVKEPDHGSIDDLKLPWVEFIEYRPKMIPFLDVSSPAVRATSSDNMSPFTAEDLGISGDGVIIAVMDSGVDNKIHESLTGKYEFGVDFSGTTTTQGIDPQDVDGHGTHVAGTALGDGGTQERYVGTAPGASLVDLKIFKSFGSILGNSDQAFEWLIENHEERNISVVQCSFGSSVTTSGRDTTAQLANQAVDEGMVVVVAAGNMGTSGLPSPASADKVITVAAYNDQNTISRNDDTVEGYSNRGPRASDGDLDSLDEMKPDISAPGTDIMAPQHDTAFGYVSMTGTSMACPHISGIAALMLEANPDLTPAEIKSILRDTSQQRYNPSIPTQDTKYNYRSGWGEVDAYGAVKRSLDLLDLTLISPDEVRSNEPMSVTSKGIFTKTTYDTESDIYTIEMSTPQAWGRPDDIITDSGSATGSASYSGPFRIGDEWVTKMEVRYNSSVEEAEPSLTVTIMPFGEEGDSAIISTWNSINGMEFTMDSKTINITEGPSPPDLSVTSLAIWFSDPLPDSGDEVDITVRVNNTGGRSVSNAVVRILDGPERTGDVIKEVELSIAASSYALAEATWIANPGIHSINVFVDPDDNIIESNEENNSAERPITVRGLNPPPIAQVEVDPSEGTTMTRFIFDGSSSQDTNIRGGNVVSYNLDFGDGKSSGWVDTPIIEHRYLSGGTFTAALTVRDNGGEESTNDAEVTVNVTDVSSQRDTLYLNSSMGLSQGQGPPSSISIGTSASSVGQWTSDPVPVTKVYHSMVSIQLMVNSSEATNLDYTVALSETGGASVERSGSTDVGVGINLVDIEFETEEVEVKADNRISFALTARIGGGQVELLIGDQGSFIDLLFYNPFNMPPEVEAGEDIEVRVNDRIDFEGSAEDTDGEITILRWDVDEDGIFDHEGSDSFQFEGYDEEGIYDVIFEARDDDGYWTTDSLKAVVRSSEYNFPPDVTMECPSEVTGIVIISGTASDDKGVESVEISLFRPSDSFTVTGWTEVDGTDEWSYEWDSRSVPDGDYEIHARAFDGAAYSDVASCTVTVENPNSPPEIVDVIVDPTSYLDGQSPMIFMELEIMDHDLPSDTLTVSADLTSMEGPDEMPLTDDGRGADREEDDGIYSGGFTPSLFLEPDIYYIDFEVEDSWGEVDRARATVEIVAEIGALVTITPRDISSGDEILMKVKIDSPVNVVVTAISDVFDGTVELKDDGTGGDEIFGDSTYSVLVAIAGEPGTYVVTITIEDEEGYELQELEENIRIAGTGSGTPSVEDDDVSMILVLSVVMIAILAVAVVAIIMMIRRREKVRVYQPMPALEVVEEVEVLRGELPIEGEMPEVPYDSHYAYDPSAE